MKSKKRLCLFAGFDAQGEIADYVIYYLKSLSQLADVYYWGDFVASDEEIAKLKPFCKAVFCEKHGKYDFGSWQELIHKIGRETIERYDEVILANDSCYGPLSDLSNLFEEMDACACDFWGLSSAYNRHIHLQSYFIVLKQSVIQSDVFYDFFEQIQPEADYDDVCLNYEDRFTYILSKSGFRPGSFIAYNDLANHPYQDIVSAIKNRHFPFLKVKFFLGDITNQGGVSDWRKVISENTDYPVELIEKNLMRRGFNLSEIDRTVREKHSSGPDFDPKKIPLKRRIRKVAKVILKPILRAHANSGIVSDNPRLQESTKPCSLKLKNLDATTIKHFALGLPLTDEANVLLIGDIVPRKLLSLEVNESRIIFLNNRSKKRSFKTNDLCGFNFVDKLGRLTYFDFILVQPLESSTTNERVKEFIANLKRQMIFESVLVMMVSNEEEKKYRQILQSEGFWPADYEHGIIARVDPFQIYHDKIESIKGYKTLIYKIK